MAKSSTDKSPTVRIVVGHNEPKKKPTAAERAHEKQSADLLGYIAHLRSSLHAGAVGHRIAIWRWNDAAKDDEYLGTLPIEEFSLDRTRELYGGGRYRARIQNETGQFLSQGGERFGFRVAGPARFPPEATPAVIGEPIAAALAEMKGYVAGLREATGKGNDLGGLATALATMQAGTMSSMVSLFAALKPTPAAAAAAGPDSLEMLDRALELLDRFKGAGGENGGDPLMVAAFGGLARALERVADAQHDRGAGPAMRALPNAKPADVQSQPTEATMPGDSVTLTDLKPYMQQLVQLARRDSDQGLYAEVMLDQLRQKPAVLAYLFACSTPDARARLQAQLLGAFPETAPYAGWFETFFSELWAAIDEPDHEPAVDPTPAPASDSGGAAIGGPVS